MGQEWDFPPRRGWQEETYARPSIRPRFERVVEHVQPKPKTAWRWYRQQMRGSGSWLYKANVTAVYLVLVGFLIAAVAIVGVFFGAWISTSAKAETIAVTNVEKALNAKAKELDYKVTFRRHNCQMAAQYVCDVNAFSPAGNFKILVASPSKDASVSHFTLIFNGSDASSVATEMAAYSVVLSATTGDHYEVDEAASLLADAVSKAKDSGETQTIPMGEAMETVSVIQQIGVVVVVGDASSN
jgi:hypothetical protein